MIKINNKEFELKYTIESWKRLKEKSEITPTNIQTKLQDDFAGNISSIIYFGLSPKDRAEITLEQLDVSFGFEVLDLVMPAIMASMPKAVNASSEREDGKEKKQ